jgi:hypothetical protein
VNIQELIYLLSSLDPEIEIGMLDNTGSMKVLEDKLTVVKSEFSLFGGQYIEVDKFGKPFYTIQVKK